MSARHHLVTCASLVVLFACSHASVNRPVGDSSGTVSVGGKDRTYVAHVPAGAANDSVALVLAFHGDGGNGADFRKSLQLETETGDEAIVIYPDAGKSQGGDASFDIDTQVDNPDVAFVDALLAKYAADYEITKVYALGHSRGAYFVNHLACYRGSKLAAIAAFSGGGPYAAPYSGGKLQCPDVPTAALVVNGLADDTVDPSEGQKSIDQWTRTLSCGAGTKLVDPSPCMTFDDCMKPVEDCKVPGLTHALWDQGVKTAWSFFKDQ